MGRDTGGGACSPLLPGCPVPTCPTLAITLPLHWAPGFFWVLVTSQGQLVAFCLCHWMKPVSAEPQLPCLEPGMLLPSFCFPRRDQAGLMVAVCLCAKHIRVPIALRIGAEQPCAGAGTDPKKTDQEDPGKNERKDTPTRTECSRVNKYLIRSHPGCPGQNKCLPEPSSAETVRVLLAWRLICLEFECSSVLLEVKTVRGRPACKRV